MNFTLNHHKFFKNPLKSWAKMVLVIFCLTILSACGEATGTPECIAADNFGDKVKKKTSLDPKKNDWTYSGIKALNGKQMEIRTTGSVSLCQDVKASYAPSPRNGAWQRSNIYVTENSYLTLKVDGKYSPWRNAAIYVGGLYVDPEDNWANAEVKPRDCTKDTIWHDNDCWSRMGKGLFVAISESSPSNVWKNPYPEVDPDFFELYNYKTNVSGYKGFVPRSGYLWFRYAENPESRDIDGKLLEGNYYSVNTCQNYGVEFLEGKGAKAVNYCQLTDGTPILQNTPAYQAECVDKNRLIKQNYMGYEQACTGQKIVKKDVYLDAGNVFEGNYSNNSPRNYTVSSTIDCVGNNGQFMAAKIGDDPNAADAATINLHQYGDAPYYGKYKANAPKTGKLWFKIIDDKDYDFGDGKSNNAMDNNYSNNSGEYSISVETFKEADDFFSSAVSGVINPIKEQFLTGSDGKLSLAEGMYRRILAQPSAEDLAQDSENLTINPSFILNIITLMLTLFITIYGLMFMLGMIQNTQSDFFMKTFKVAIVIALIQPDSWEFFHKYLFTIFIDGTESLVALMTGQFAAILDGSYDPNITVGQNIQASIDDPFAFVNQTFARFTTMETWFKITALLTVFPIGWLYVVMIIFGMYLYFIAIVKAVILYLLAIIAVALLLALAPIFIAMVLFEFTKGYTTNWLMNLLNYSLQPVFLFSLLSILNIFVYSAFYTVLSYEVCLACAWQFTMPLGTNLLEDDYLRFCMLGYYTPYGISEYYNNYEGNVGVGFFFIMIFIIIVRLFDKMMNVVVELAASLTTGQSGTSLGTTAGEMATSFDKASRWGMKNSAKLAVFAAKAPYKLAKRISRGSNKEEGDK